MSSNSRQPKWDIYESVVLLDGYLEALKKEQPKARIIKRVSDNLRQMAINRGITIDGIYRNENGISYQMQSMDSAFKSEKIYVPATKLFADTVELYRTDIEKYRKILEEARGMIAGQKTNKEAFMEWATSSLSEKRSKWIEENILRFEAIAVSSKIITGSIFDTSDPEILEKIYRTAEKNKIFQIKYRKLIKNINEDFRTYIYYCSSVKDMSHAEDVSTFTNSEKSNGEAVSDTEQQLPIDQQLVDFSSEVSLAYTKPTSVFFDGLQLGNVSSWKDVYLSVVTKLYELRPETFANLRALPGFTRLEFGNFSESAEMTAPKKINDVLYVETNFSATDIVKRIKELLSMCGIDPEILKIGYQNRVNGNSANVSIPQGTDSSAPEASFRMYLKNVAKLADATCSSYCSSIRGAERYALEHGFAHCHLYSEDKDEITATVKMLYEDAGFLKYNEQQHNRFSAAINKLLESIGVNPPGKSAIPEENDSKESMDVHPEIMAVLKEHYEYGFKIDSLIELMRFRQFAEEMGVIVDADDADLKSLILASGTMIDGRVYCKSSSLKEELQSTIERAASEGVTVLYYDCLFDSESEMMEKHVITSPEMLKEYLQKNITGWSFSKRFMVKGERCAEKVAVSEEIKRVWGDYAVLNVNTLSERLPYIPIGNIWRVISGNDAFVLAGEGEYLLVERFRITEEEEEEILDFVNEQCEQDGFASISDVPLGDIEEENYELSRLVIYNAIYKKVLAGRYQLNAKILTKDESGLDAVQVLKQSLAGKDEYTVDKALSKVKEITGTTNRSYAFQALYDEMVRVDKNRFVATRFVHFPVDEIDTILSDFVRDGFCAVRDVTTFAMFPLCAQPWNHYLLESFCYKYSRKYSLHAIHFNDKNAGIIAEKDFNKTYNQMLAMALARTDIELNSDAAGTYLFDAGYMSKRKYSQLDDIVQQAMELRKER